MDSDAIKKVLREAQQVARLLAPYQNFGDVTMPTSPAMTLYRKLIANPVRRVYCWLFKSQYPAELTTRDVTRIVNVLCNCVCAIDTLTRSTPIQQEKPCPTNSEPAQI